MAIRANLPMMNWRGFSTTPGKNFVHLYFLLFGAHPALYVRCHFYCLLPMAIMDNEKALRELGPLRISTKIQNGLGDASFTLPFGFPYWY